MAKKPRKRNLSFEVVRDKKRFEVLGKKRTAGDGKRGKARSAGIEKRKNTLLVELKESRRGNQFLDRRIGEHDEGLTAEDKAIARFQKQRLKDLSDQRYSLPDNEEEQLRPDLGDEEGLGWGSAAPLGLADSDPEDDELFTQAHFGGGELERTSRDADSPQGNEEQRHRSKKEVMEEVIAKSKAHKAEKVKQREADLDATEDLDKQLSALLQSGALRTLKGNRRLEASQPSEAAIDAMESAFDRDRRELIQQAKGKAGERAKTAEELAVAEEKQIAAQDKLLAARMTEAEDSLLPLGEGVEQQGGYAGRRAKRARLEQAEPTGDTLEDVFEAGDSEGSDVSENEGSQEQELQAGKRQRKDRLSLDERRAQRAAGDHPLQQSFRQLASELMSKHGLSSAHAAQSDGEEESLATVSESEVENSENSMSGGGELESGESQSDGELEMATDSPATEQPAKVHARLAATEVQEPRKQGPSLEERVAGLKKLPDTYESFLELLSGAKEQDLHPALAQLRILAAKSSSGDRQQLQLLFGFLVQLFADRAGEEPVPMTQLDMLTQHILVLAPQVPLFAATTALARLQRLQERLTSTLSGSDNLQAGKTGWPPQRQLLLLKLWATIFPPSDRRHPVLTPAALLISAYLALCSVRSLQDVKSGLFLASLSLHMASGGKRVVTEPLAFAMRFLQTLVSKPELQAPKNSSWQLFQVSWGVPPWKPSNKPPAPLNFSQATSIEDECQGCFVAALGIVSQTAAICTQAVSLPELLRPACLLLQTLGKEELPEYLHAQRRDVLAGIQAQVAQAEGGRQPLRKVKLHKEAKQFNPRFEEDFAAERDYDPDRDRAEARKLKRLVAKERRGAMRELRRDAEFLGDEARKQKDAARAELKHSLRKNSAWLQNLESDLKSGGQGGMWKKKKRK